MDLILRNAKVVDPRNQICGPMDIGIEGGSIAKAGEYCGAWSDGPQVDLTGKTIIPGVIDNHTHLRALRPEQLAAGLRDVTRMGTTTAVDFSGPVSELMENINACGTGLNIGVLNAIRPGFEIRSSDPSTDEIESFLEQSLRQGAIGLKILGGQRPCTPDATRRIIHVANTAQVYVAFHFGTTENSSDFNGLKEAITFGKEGLRLHICHIGGALRALVLDDVIEEARIALQMLDGLDTVVSESLLAQISCDGGRCTAGEPDSNIVKTRMRTFGYDPTQAGVERAILDGKVLVLSSHGGYNNWVTGEAGIAEWRDCETDTSIGYPINDKRIAFLCATTKGLDDRFVVDAIASDGGALPRNFNVTEGMALVKFNALSLSELAYKLSYAPARMLGLENKGHLGIGADADITVIDEATCTPYMTVVNGKINMLDGIVLGSGVTFLVTSDGKQAAQERGIDFQVIHPERGWLYQSKLADQVHRSLL